MKRKNATRQLVGLRGQPQRKPEAHVFWCVIDNEVVHTMLLWPCVNTPVASLGPVRGRSLALVLSIRRAFAAINAKDQMTYP